MEYNHSVILTKVRSNHCNLPNIRYTGWSEDKPKVGQRFEMVTREDGELQTTPVEAMRFLSDTETEFDTRNSTYRVEYVRSKPMDKVYLDPLESDILSTLTEHGIVDILGMIARLRQLVDKLVGR